MAAMNVYVKSFVWAYISFLLGIYLVELLGQMVPLSLTFWLLKSGCIVFFAAEKSSIK